MQVDVVREVADNLRFEKNQEDCASLIQKQSGGVDGIRGVFRAQPNIYDRTFCENRLKTAKNFSKLFGENKCERMQFQ